jgi:hypothetical protein
MDLMAWATYNSHEALAIILTLLDKTEDDAATQESIAGGEVQTIVEWPPADFLPFLAQAVRTHPRFALCTNWLREHPESGRWKELQEAVKAQRDVLL